MQNEMNFIIATEENCLELACFNKCLIDDGGSINTMSLTELEARMRDFMSREYFIAIFEIDGHHIGYTLIDRTVSPIFIRHFYIDQMYRRRGYGRTAFKKLIEFFGVNEVDLKVLSKNEVGYKFWKSCGLVPFEHTMHYRQKQSFGGKENESD